MAVDEFNFVGEFCGLDWFELSNAENKKKN